MPTARLQCTRPLTEPRIQGLGDLRAWNSLSAAPSTLLACVSRSAGIHAMLGEARAFSVNLLASDHPELVAIFSAAKAAALTRCWSVVSTFGKRTAASVEADRALAMTYSNVEGMR